MCIRNITFPVYTTEEHVTVIRKTPTQPLELEMYRTGDKRVNDDGIANPTTGIIAGGMTSFTDDNTGELMTTEQPEPGAWLACRVYTSPSPRDRQKTRMPTSA